MTDPITLMICDDHRLLTDALTIAVRDDEAIDLVAPAFADPEDAIAAVAAQPCDVVLMDVSFEGSALSGIEATRRIKAVSPETKVVIVTAQEEEVMVEAVEAGASGFLRKSDAVGDVIDAAKAAARGEVLVDAPTLSRVLASVSRDREERSEAERRLASLTPREVEILRLLAEGGRNEDLGARLGVTTTTVQTHIHNILDKLGVHSKLEAVVYGVRYGLIDV